MHIENLNELNKEHSPSVPKSFPKSRLPKDMCQNSLAKMVHCLTESQPNLCGELNKMYYTCRRERDAQIYSSIKDWEVNHFNSELGSGQQYQQDHQRAYLDDIKAQREQLVQLFEKTPSSIANKHKRWRMAADIEQLQWRHDYLLQSVT